MNRATLHITAETFDEIFRLHGKKVYAVCMHHLQDRECARDITQDIFRSLWERRNELNIESVEHYLIRSAKLKVLECFRKKYARAEKNKLIQINFNEADDSTLSDIITDDLMANAWKELEYLPAKTREIFRKSRMHGFSNKEIAQHMQLSEKAVEYHITRALEHFRGKGSMVFA